MGALSKTQRKWMDKLNKVGRVRYGASFPAGMPERTAESLRRRGLVRFERQPVFRKSNLEHPQGVFVVPVESESFTRPSPKPLEIKGVRVMPCPTCKEQIRPMGGGYFHCPECGTLQFNVTKQTSHGPTTDVETVVPRWAQEDHPEDPDPPGFAPPLLDPI